MSDFKKFTSKEVVEAIPEINESWKEWLIKRWEFSLSFVYENFEHSCGCSNWTHTFWADRPGGCWYFCKQPIMA